MSDDQHVPSRVLVACDRSSTYSCNTCAVVSLSFLLLSFLGGRNERPLQATETAVPPSRFRKTHVHSLPPRGVVSMGGTEKKYARKCKSAREAATACSNRPKLHSFTKTGNRRFTATSEWMLYSIWETTCRRPGLTAGVDLNTGRHFTASDLIDQTWSFTAPGTSGSEQRERGVVGDVKI